MNEERRRNDDEIIKTLKTLNESVNRLEIKIVGEICNRIGIVETEHSSLQKELTEYKHDDKIWKTNAVISVAIPILLLLVGVTFQIMRGR